LARVQLQQPELVLVLFLQLEQPVPELFLRMAVVLVRLQPCRRQPMGSAQPLEQPERDQLRRCKLLELVCSTCCHQMTAAAASAI
tara:strand:+ start:90167 stop:90421 length:255 start_codon:yes stop_codon:yes gene_type:complete